MVDYIRIAPIVSDEVDNADDTLHAVPQQFFCLPAQRFRQSRIHLHAVGFIDCAFLVIEFNFPVRVQFVDFNVPVYAAELRRLFFETQKIVVGDSGFFENIEKLGGYP